MKPREYIIAIKEDIRDKLFTQTQIADMHNVSTALVKGIASGRYHKDIIVPGFDEKKTRRVLKEYELVELELQLRNREADLTQLSKDYRLSKETLIEFKRRIKEYGRIRF